MIIRQTYTETIAFLIWLVRYLHSCLHSPLLSIKLVINVSSMQSIGSVHHSNPKPIPIPLNVSINLTNVLSIQNLSWSSWSSPRFFGRFLRHFQCLIWYHLRSFPILVIGLIVKSQNNLDYDANGNNNNKTRNNDGYKTPNKWWARQNCKSSPQNE